MNKKDNMVIDTNQVFEIGDRKLEKFSFSNLGVRDDGEIQNFQVLLDTSNDIKTYGTDTYENLVNIVPFFNPVINKLMLQTEDNTLNSQLTNWSLQQYCQLLGVPAEYIKSCIGHNFVKLVENNLQQWRDLVDVNKKVLIRKYNNRIRGLLSDRYTICDSHTVLNLLQNNLRDKGNYAVLSKYYDAERLVTRIVGKDRINVDGEDLYYGFQVVNSDVGQRSLGCRYFLYRSACSNGLLFGKRSIASMMKRHIGNADNMTDKFVHFLNEFQGYIDQFKPKILIAKETKLSDSDYEKYFLRFRQEMNIGNKVVKDFTTFQNKYPQTVWGFVNSITEYAQTHEIDRQLDLEEYAGELLEKIYVS